jgi:hypothetical protein
MQGFHSFHMMIHSPIYKEMAIINPFQNVLFSQQKEFLIT